MTYVGLVTFGFVHNETKRVQKTDKDYILIM